MYCQITSLKAKILLQVRGQSAGQDRGLPPSFRLYDPKNMGLIITNIDLELAFGQKFLHISELRDAVLTHMQYMPPIMLPLMPGPQEFPPPVLPQGFDKEAQFMVTPKFLKVLHKVPGVDKNQRSFSYSQLCSLLSSYILMNKDDFFDARNIRIAHIEGDLL